MIYFLKVDNSSGTLDDGQQTSYRTIRDCALPFDDKMTVLDMLQKFGIEDNISFYSNSHKDGRGKRDFILNLVWAAEFESPLQRHLSGVQGEHEILDSYD